MVITKEGARWLKKQQLEVKTEDKEADYVEEKEGRE